MQNNSNLKTLNKEEALPDITTQQQSTLQYPIDQVGMGALEMIVNIDSPDGKQYSLPAKIDTFVNLEDINSKGIHMSRLYASTYKFFKTTTLTPKNVEQLLEELIVSQKGLSSESFLNIKFDYMIEHSSLLSETKGMRHYPIEMNFQKKKNQISCLALKFKITYSSACPCSTALSQKYIQDQLEKSFDTDIAYDKKSFTEWLKKQNVLAAIPHSQRSYADITLTFKEIPHPFVLDTIILAAEKTIKTTVQTSVKRADEQEFAKINADNLMFCEDAVRILKNHYIKASTLKSFHISISHQESLHAHNAVASVYHQFI